MSDADNKYHLDKTAFAAMSFEESDNHYGHWKNKSYSERLDVAFFLIHQSYGTTNKTPIDKTVFSQRKNK